MEHNDRRGLEVYMAKHNYYSSAEAREIMKVITRRSSSRLKATLRGNALERRRWFKHVVYPRLPAKWLFRFIHMYLLRLGFLDGITGLRFCLFISTYELLIALKIVELQQERAVAIAAGGSTAEPAPAPPVPATSPVPPASGTPANPSGAPRPATLVRTRDERSDLPDEEIARDRAFQQAQVSPWTTKEKLGRALWMIVRGTLFRFSWHNSYRWRAFLLRLFGAKIGKSCMIRPTVRVEVPWMVTIDDYVALGDFAIIYSLGPITIGRRVTVSQYAHLCAGSHDYTRPDLPLLRPPITIEPDAWIAADAFVGPGVTVGRGAILGACAVTMRDLKPWTIYAGHPAKEVKHRPPFEIPGVGP
jgi:putative colanic acid biosynthesis acetyltransferase WcaF